ncbi:hypothetical protein [Kaistella antarctica]|uniref:DUF4292 domain-containing protein n=2 Tax=Kaistella antarctica TaxID=266748 RepID=A0A448NSN3_9FLAO|nr:hypothetical protein [Kaistella antarctica]SEV80962.1 hypothetical protein SAMN05421765_0197 [Kaistella antarctica]VEI00237.1 Uncharacterised protein [Kaistella antarctica]
MKKIIFIPLIMFCVLSCAQNEKLGYKKLNLETFNFDKKMDDYFSKEKFLQKDTLELDYDSTKIVNTYMTFGDSLSFYGETFFNGIVIIQDENKQLMAIKTSFRHDNNIVPLTQFIGELTTKYGNPEIVNRKNIDSDYTSCYWQLSDRMIIVNSVFNSKLYYLKLTNELKDKISLRTELFIVKKDFQEKLIGKTHRGEWMNLDLQN